jgi:hypothetical protein
MIHQDLASFKEAYKARLAQRKKLRAASKSTLEEDPCSPFCNCRHFKLANVFTKETTFRGRTRITISHRRICHHCGKSWVRVVSDKKKDDPPDQPTAATTPPRKKKAKAEADPSYLPTPDEIREGCEAIKAGWSPREMKERAAWTHSPWSMPDITLASLPKGLTAES